MEFEKPRRFLKLGKLKHIKTISDYLSYSSIINVIVQIVCK